MKTTRYLKWMVVLALALASGWSAMAQRTRMSGTAPAVPGPNDYDKFAQFITTRNIFNPQRYAIRVGQIVQRQTPTYAPTFTLVGTMNYEKGMFAFFDGNQNELRKVLYTSDTNGIAGYVLTNISSASVVLLAPDKKETVEMKIGDSMVQQGAIWVPRLAMASRTGFSSSRNSRYDGGGGGNDYGSRNGFGGGQSTMPEAESSSPETSPAPSPALEGNDILKRLMQKREQEIK
jgi:hypothetical protein